MNQTRTVGEAQSPRSQLLSRLNRNCRQSVRRTPNCRSRTQIRLCRRFLCQAIRSLRQSDRESNSREVLRQRHYLHLAGSLAQRIELWNIRPLAFNSREYQNRRLNRTGALGDGIVCANVFAKISLHRMADRTFSFLRLKSECPPDEIIF